MRYTVYKFPSLGGSPKQFRFKLTAWMYAKTCLNMVCELEDNETGEYFAYWT